MPASIFNGDAIKLLKDKLRFKDGVEIITDDSDDPTSVAKDAPAGSMYIRQGTSEIYKKLDSGSSTNWTKENNYVAQPKVTLSAGDIINKFILLDEAPIDKTSTRLTVVGGVPQEYAVDFEVTNDDGGRRLSWSTLGLDGVLESGDILIIEYN